MIEYIEGTNLYKSKKQLSEDQIRFLSKSDLSLIQPLIKKFEEIDFEKLPYCFVHGDIISTNVMKDDKSNLFIVDFSVSNYYPRIQEIAILTCNLFFDQNDANRWFGVLVCKRFKKSFRI